MCVCVCVCVCVFERERERNRETETDIDRDKMRGRAPAPIGRNQTAYLFPRIPPSCSLKTQGPYLACTLSDMGQGSTGLVAFKNFLF